jgi:hypothetical protein
LIPDEASQNTLPQKISAQTDKRVPSYGLSKLDILQQFCGAAMAMFVAVPHGDFMVLTYKNKEAKN